MTLTTVLGILLVLLLLLGVPIVVLAIMGGLAAYVQEEAQRDLDELIEAREHEDGLGDHDGVTDDPPSEAIGHSDDRPSSADEDDRPSSADERDDDYSPESGLGE